MPLRGAPASWRKKVRPRLERSSSTPGQIKSGGEKAGLESRLRMRRHRARRLAEDDCFLELCMLARQIGIDVDEVQELKGVFDSFDRTRSGLLDRSGFRALIKGAFAFDKKDDIPDEFLDARWFELQSLDENRIPTIDFEGFLRWYQAHWFVEQLLINKAVRFTRNVARKHGLGFANVERIYRVFVEFDEDCSRKIEPPEFRKLICRLL